MSFVTNWFTFTTPFPKEKPKDKKAKGVKGLKVLFPFEAIEAYRPITIFLVILQPKKGGGTNGKDGKSENEGAFESLFSISLSLSLSPFI